MENVLRFNGAKKATKSNNYKLKIGVFVRKQRPKLIHKIDPSSNVYLVGMALATICMGSALQLT
jgi:hypothetical protein